MSLRSEVSWDSWVTIGGLSKIHAGSPAPAWVNLSRECWQEKAAIRWRNRCQQAFDNLKRFCTTAPILACVDFTHPFKLHTNSCGSGLGDVHYQTHEDSMDAFIAYASRSLTKAKSHYLTHKLEFLTLTLAVVEKFHAYIMDQHLTYIPTTTL